MQLLLAAFSITPQMRILKLILCCPSVVADFSWLKVVFALLMEQSTQPFLNLFHDIWVPSEQFYLFICHVLTIIFNMKQTHLIAFFPLPKDQMVTNEIVPLKQIKEESKRTDGG